MLFAELATCNNQLLACKTKQTPLNKNKHSSSQPRRVTIRNKNAQRFLRVLLFVLPCLLTMYRRVFVREMHFLRYVGPANVYKPTSQPSQQVINDKKFDAQSKEVGRIVKPPVPGSTPENQLTYDQVTHTGQAFDNEDVRLGRFHDGFKLVNPNVAMHMIAQVKPIPVHGRIATCDGGGGALGHPKVFINLDKSGNHTCGYCGLRFYKEGLENDGTNHISV